MTNQEPKKRGRPPSGKTKSQLVKDSKKRTKTVNISLDKEILEALQSEQTRLSEKLGFNLTMKQAFKFILSEHQKSLKVGGNNNEPK